MVSTPYKQSWILILRMSPNLTFRLWGQPTHSATSPFNVYACVFIHMFKKLLDFEIKVKVWRKKKTIPITVYPFSGPYCGLQEVKHLYMVFI